MLKGLLSLIGMRSAPRGLLGRSAGRTIGLSGGGLLPIAAYLAWTNRDKIRAAYLDWRDRHNTPHAA